MASDSAPAASTIMGMSENMFAQIFTSLINTVATVIPKIISNLQTNDPLYQERSAMASSNDYTKQKAAANELDEELKRKAAEATDQKLVEEKRRELAARNTELGVATNSLTISTMVNDGTFKLEGENYVDPKTGKTIFSREDFKKATASATFTTPNTGTGNVKEDIETMLTQHKDQRDAQAKILKDSYEHLKGTNNPLIAQGVLSAGKTGEPSINHEKLSAYLKSDNVNRAAMVPQIEGFGTALSNLNKSYNEFYAIPGVTRTPTGPLASIAPSLSRKEGLGRNYDSSDPVYKNNGYANYNSTQVKPRFEINA